MSEDRYLQAKLPKPSADILAKNPSFLSSLSTSLEENFRKLKLDISRADGTEAIPTGGKTSNYIFYQFGQRQLINLIIETSGKDTGTGTDAQRRGAASSFIFSILV